MKIRHRNFLHCQQQPSQPKITIINNTLEGVLNALKPVTFIIALTPIEMGKEKMEVIFTILLITGSCKAAPGPIHEEVVNYFNGKIQEILDQNPAKMPETNDYEREFNEYLKKLNASHVGETNVVTATTEAVVKIENALKEFQDYQKKRADLESELTRSIKELEESLESNIVPNELKDDGYKQLLLMERSKRGKTKEMESSLKDYGIFKKSTKIQTTSTPMQKTSAPAVTSVTAVTTLPPSIQQPSAEISQILNEILTTLKSFSNPSNKNVLGVLVDSIKPIKDLLESLLSALMVSSLVSTTNGVNRNLGPLINAVGEKPTNVLSKETEISEFLEKLTAKIDILKKGDPENIDNCLAPTNSYV
uniref:Uncharacterized protein n=1 Tax=Glossina pallidipes TaxID=7398 RepID=A0A1A9ZH89_GLOPL